jgi:hypothetical protein
MDACMDMRWYEEFSIAMAMFTNVYWQPPCCLSCCWRCWSFPGPEIPGVNADKNAPSFIISPLSTSVTSGSIQVFLGKSPIFGGCTLGPRPPKIQQKKDIFVILCPSIVLKENLTGKHGFFRDDIIYRVSRGSMSISYPKSESRSWVYL